MGKAAKKTLGVGSGIGIGIGISRTPPSDLGPLALGVKGGEDVSGDGTERPAVDGRLVLQKRGMSGTGTGSLVCRTAGRLSGSPAELGEWRSASAEERRARLGWLNFRNKREKGMGMVQNP